MIASVVIPAHNEQRGIGATLTALHDGVPADDLEVVVVCNGCTDATADTVRAGFPTARVVEIAEPSKASAVDAGNAVCTAFPRVHLDADVQLSGDSLLALLEGLEGPVLAVAPERVIDRTGCSPLVSWYYDVWERLPQVEDGLFGRGVFALSQEGQARVAALPRLMSDDLAVSESFAAHERRVVRTATSRVVPPRRTADLVRRRVRIATGGAQAQAAGVRHDSAVTRVSTLVELCRRRPRLMTRVPVFLALTALARWRARAAVRHGDFDTWLRDESSRG